MPFGGEKKKPVLAIALGFGKKKDDSEKSDRPSSPEMESEEESVDGEDMALDELWDAIKGGDKEAFKEAIRSWKDCCGEE